MVQESARHRTQGASGAMLGTQTHVETANQAHLGFLTAGLARLVEMVSKRSSIGTSGRRCSRSPLGGRLATTLVATISTESEKHGEPRNRVPEEGFQK